MSKKKPHIYIAFGNTYFQNISRMFSCTFQPDNSFADKLIKGGMSILFLIPLLITGIIFCIAILLEYLAFFSNFLLDKIFQFLSYVRGGINKDILGYIFSPLLIALGLPLILLIIILPRFGGELSENEMTRNQNTEIDWISVPTFNRIKRFYTEAIVLLSYRNNDRPVIERLLLIFFFYIPNLLILLVALVVSGVIILLDAVSIITELYRRLLLYITKQLSNGMCRNGLYFISNNCLILITAPIFLVLLVAPKISSVGIS